MGRLIFRLHSPLPTLHSPLPPRHRARFDTCAMRWMRLYGTPASNRESPIPPTASASCSAPPFMGCAPPENSCAAANIKTSPIFLPAIRFNPRLSICKSRASPRRRVRPARRASAASPWASRSCAGQLDLVVAGGYDTISEYVYGGFNSLRLVSPGTLRPFTRDRQGMKLAEGYGIVVLEAHRTPSGVESTRWRRSLDMANPPTLITSPSRIRKAKAPPAPCPRRWRRPD